MKQNEFDPTGEPNTYQTGSISPPQAKNGLIAILLVLVTLLAGMVSILSMMNIRLFSVLKNRQIQQAPLTLQSAVDTVDRPLNGEDALIRAVDNKSIGIAGDPITPVYQQHFQLPEGLIITYVEENAQAALQGVEEGDVLLSLNAITIPDPEALLRFLDTQEVGDECTAEIYRRDTNERYTVTLMIEEIAPEVE